MKFPVIKRFGERAVLLEWPEMISQDILSEVHQYNQFIEDRFYKEIVETVPAYQSIAVYLRKLVDPIDFIKVLEQSHISMHSAKRSRNTLMVPVCYDSTMAEDLEHISSHAGLSESEVIRLHSEAIYEVAFLGFLPGFAYLTGLPKELYVPRKTMPRRSVPKGAVAIGGRQTGIYPMKSPGGWNIIGRCPLVLFDVKKPKACLFQPGDLVRFQKISEQVFHEIASLSEKGLYETQILES